MTEQERLEELHTQIGLVHDIIRQTDAKDPKQEQLRILLASMYQKLNELTPARDKLEKTLLSEDSL